MDNIEHKTEATHYVIDLYGVANSEILDDMEKCLEMITIAIKKANCGILNIYTHRFSPQGLSINATLSESHCTIHTWPEKNYCAIDLYGCGDKPSLEKGVEYFLNTLKPEKKSIIKLKRGYENLGCSI